MSLPPTLAPGIRQTLATSVAEATFSPPDWYPRLADWVRNPAAPESVAHNYCLALSVRGPVDQIALQASLCELVRRHDVLRSVFSFEGAELLQHIRRVAGLSLTVGDLSFLPSDAATARAKQLVIEEARRPFDFRAQLLLRSSLIRLSVEHHVLVLATHHAVCDDWSVGIIFRELVALYSANVTRSPSQLGGPAPSYSHFAAGLCSRITSGEFRRHPEFWIQYLLAAGDFHHLVTDHPGSSHPTCDGAHAVWRSSETFAESLRCLAIRERVSPFMVLVAALQCALARECGAYDIGVGTCVANRPSTAAQELVGPLSNRIFLRTDLSGDPTLREILRRVRSSALDAYSYQDLPFGEILKTLARPVANGRSPLFQTLIVQKEDPLFGLSCPHFDLAWFDVDPGTTRYDLNVWVQFKPPCGLEVDFQYNRGLFLPGTIEHLLANYTACLVSMVENVTLRLSQIPLDAPPEQPSATVAQALPTGPTYSPDPATLTVAGIFEEVLGAKPVGSSSDFFALGGTSLQAAQLFARIEQRFKIKLPFSALLRARTPAQLAALLRTPQPRDAASSLVAVQPRGSKLPLLCVHSHRGDVLFCGPLSRNLGDDQPVLAFQSRGLAGAPLFTVEEIAAAYTDELLADPLPDPYLLFGYSFGGLVAFEMAARLAAKGRRVAFLGMFNTPAPGSLTRWPLGQPSYLRKKTGHAIAMLHTLNEGQRIAHFSKKLSNFAQLLFGSLRTDLWRFAVALTNRRWMERVGKHILNVGQINIAAAKEYRPRSVFAGRITFLISRRFPYLFSIGPREGWSSFASDGIDLVEIPDSEQVPFDLAMSRTLEAKIKLAGQQIVSDVSAVE